MGRHHLRNCQGQIQVPLTSPPHHPSRALEQGMALSMLYGLPSEEPCH